MRRTILAFAVLMGATCPAARAATQLAISTPTRVLRLVSPDAVFHMEPFERNGVTGTRVYVGDYPDAEYDLYLVPPPGQTYAPGTHEGVASFDPEAPNPGMRVVAWDESSCTTPSAMRFTILDVAYVAGEMVRLSVDFEQDCVGNPEWVISGSLRVGAGDAACAGLADGSPCDDLDACTANAQCAAQQCAGGERTDCGSPPDACHDPVVCAPVSGTCLPRTTPKPDLARCDDGNACSAEERCRSGVCTSFYATNCDDSEACTWDFCDPGIGCYHPDVAGTCGTPGSPSSYLFVESPAGEPIGEGRNRSISGSPYVGVNQDESILHFEFSDQQTVPAGRWSVSVGPPVGQQLKPGVYENTRRYIGIDTHRPLLGIFNWDSSASCDESTGRFIVHEVATTPPELYPQVPLTFVGEIEFRCTSEGPPLRAALRYRAGDAACFGEVDGTPCDDRNACTSGDACHGGVCTGGSATMCGAAEGCLLASVCDVVTGECLPPSAQHDLVPCTDPAACVPSGECQAGVCVPDAVVCDDYDVCTADACDGAGGCRHAPIAGTCWERRGSVTFAATARGHTCRCTAKTTVQPLALLEDGSFAIPGGPTACANSTMVIPPEIGTWEEKGRMRRLTTTNLDELLDVAMQCTNTSVRRPTRYTTSVRLSRKGSALRGRHVERVKSGGVVLDATINFRGKPTTTGRIVDGPTGAGRCIPRLIACLRSEIEDE